jgi:tetratricopeptide (TPR) repeat protein
LPAEARQQVDAATEELKGSFTSRQDDFAAHFNRGNFYMDRRDYDTAIEALGTASKLRPDFLAARVNIAFAYNAQGKNDQAEAAFRKALELDPNSAIIYMNFGMLLGEMGRPDEAKDAFLRSYRLDPNNPQPAYNLGVILAETDPDASLAWVKQAYDLRPQDDKFGFTYAFYLARRGRVDEAIPILNRQIDAKVAGIDAYMLLVEIYQSQGRIDQVKGVFERALQNLELSSQDRDYLQAQIQRIP